MPKPLTWESLETEPKFNIELDVKTHKDLIRYIILTNEGKGRIEFINSLIAKNLEGKVLTNDFIKLEEPFYFNKSELLTNKTVKASKIKPLQNLDEVFIVESIPNNLDDFNKDLKTYCVGDNANQHAGYFILPCFKNSNPKNVINQDFTFNYDSEAQTLEINLVNHDLINVYFDSDKEAIKNKLLADFEIIKKKLITLNININDLKPYLIMHSYISRKTTVEKKDQKTGQDLILSPYGLIFSSLNW